MSSLFGVSKFKLFGGASIAGYLAYEGFKRQTSIKEEASQEEPISDDIKHRVESANANAITKEQNLFSLKNKVYLLPSEFIESHPGGSKVLSMVKNYDIEKVWNANAYKFHYKSANVKDALDKFYLTEGSLPIIPDDKLKEITIATKFNPQIYIQHNPYNAEPKDLIFSDDGETEDFFVREHGEYSKDKEDMDVKLLDGGVYTLNNDYLRTLPTETIFQPIICAGAGRSKFDFKANGTQWGEKGGDAIGTMRLKATSIDLLLEELFLRFKNPCLMIVTGTDGYETVVHSSEFNKFHLSTQMEDGSDLPDIHGRERRLVGEGVPGFRNIKSVESIEFKEEISQDEVTQILTKRLGEPMNMLSSTERQILAACPKYDAYVLRDLENNKPFGFNLYFPVSSIITEVETCKTNGKEKDHIQGIAFSGKGVIKKVLACRGKDKTDCTDAKISIPPNGNGKFVFWSADLPAAKGAVSAKAFDDRGESQLDKAPANGRGLYKHQGVDVKTL